MAKLSLDVVTNGATLSTLNANFDKIESEFQNRVLYRDNVSLETNTMLNDVDMNGHNISNVDTVLTQAIVVNGVVYEVVLQGFVDAATAQAAIAQAQALIATNQANTAGTHAANSLNSANNSATSAANALASEIAAAASAASIANGPVFSFNGRFGVVTLTETDVLDTGILDNADLTGVPTAPTAAAGTTTTQVATTAFVAGNATNAPSTMNGVGAIGTSTRHARGDHVHPTDTSRAPLASPVFTGVPTAPTAALDTSTSQLATTAYVIGQNTFRDTRAVNHNPYTYRGATVHIKTNTTDGLSDGGTFHGVLDIVHYTDSTGGVDHQLAFTDNGNMHLRWSTSPTTWGAWNRVWAANNDGAGSGLDADLLDGVQGSSYALLNSPTFTGTVIAPTLSAANNTNQVATTAFVKSIGYAQLASPTFTGTVTAPDSLVTNTLGFTTGAGGSVTQATSKSTNVTLNKSSGQIVMNAASLAAGATVAFAFLNSVIGANDIVLVKRSSGGTNLSYRVDVDVIGAGFCNITLTNTSAGALAEAVTLTFIVIKASIT